jgi:integrase
MPAQKRIKTRYPGVLYIEGTGIDGKPERIYMIRYRKKGKAIEEKAGRQIQDDMTPARAATIRAERIKGQLSNEEKRQAEKARKQAEAGKWTIHKLWNEYTLQRKPGKSLATDTGRYEKYIKLIFGDKQPSEIAPLDIDRLRIKLAKTLAPQSVKHILNLLTWIINFGVQKGLCNGITFKIKKPSVDNKKTEDLTKQQLQVLLKAIDETPNRQIANLMRLALVTGMRRGELIRLRWDDIDFEKGFIRIREPKGGQDQTIPLNTTAQQILEEHERTGSEYVFPGEGGKQRASVQAGVNKIKKAAGLPKDFRPLHGLRHHFASTLASSGAVDMYTLQRLLTHKSPVMTQRYAHLRDEALKKASNLASELIGGSQTTNAIDLASVNMKKK